jgi:2-oxoglutarate ferredoxin oxidoreductase subunit alpha
MKILMSGNEAFGESAIHAGCKFYAGYPITPQNELTEYMSRRMLEEGRAFIQAESELAAINMVFGASLSGVRAMTSSSSPGISLKQEGISYLAGCQLPAVIINVMRGGPGLGNIAPSQADYFQATRGGGHGDYRTIVLAPSSVEEIIKLTYLAFDLADKYRIPVILLGDGMLGQMREGVDASLFDYKPEIYPKPWALTGCKDREPNVVKSLLLKPEELEALNIELQEKYHKIEENEIRYEEFIPDNCEVLLIAYGTVSRICKYVAKKAKKENLKVGVFRPITLWPFPTKRVAQLAKEIKKMIVVEMSSGQMIEDVKLAVSGEAEVEFYGRMGGEIVREEEILNKIQKFYSIKL